MSQRRRRYRTCLEAACTCARANIGSAVNDTTRELGGALGVAIVGSIMSSLYATRLTDAHPDDVPAPVAAAARESLGGAVQAGGALPAPTSQTSRARRSFTPCRAPRSWSPSSPGGAVVAWRHLPARGIDDQDEAQVSAGTDDVLATVSS